MNGAMTTTVGRQHRASSAASSVSDKPFSPSLSSCLSPPSAVPPPPSAPTPAQALPSRNQQQFPNADAVAEPAPPPPSTEPPSVHPSLLQPRVAVVLNVPPPWHPWLFALRLASILPAVWWGLPSALQLLLLLLPGSETVLPSGQQPPPLALCSTAHISHADGTVRYALAEAALATIWVNGAATVGAKQCFACGYLSFFFTDCLMSRWLINYTPQATIVRLLTINAVNAYVTLSVLSLTGGFDDARLLLPGWIGIATTLTVCYHITHQTINIRKETSTSINVFSIASFITMITLLVHMHSCAADYPTMPIAARGQHLWNEAVGLMAQIKKAVEHAEL